jgi:exodeoxyribonuclease-3
MRIVTWNVNSVRVRQEKVEEWLQKWEPDVLCLQEIKVVDDDFPVAAFEALGYRSIVYGQKTYNGVAILHKGEAENVQRGFDDGGEEDPQARILRGTFNGVRVVNAYCPNGQALDSDKFVYKMGWFAAAICASSATSTSRRRTGTSTTPTSGGGRSTSASPSTRSWRSSSGGG